jgi:hypothetical protein
MSYLEVGAHAREITSSGRPTKAGMGAFWAMAVVVRVVSRAAVAATRVLKEVMISPR